MKDTYENLFSAPAEQDEVCDEAEETAEAEQADEVLPIYPLTRRQKWRRALPYAVVYARYLLPVISMLFLLVSGFFYAVRGVNVGSYYEVSVWRLYANTFTGTHAYLGTDGNVRADGLYTALSIGAIVGVLVLLIALFLNVLAAVTALRAFRAGGESDKAHRMRIKFKIAFPNRICLFLANLLLIVPVLYPNFYSAISANYMLVGATNVFYVTLNRPLIVLSVLSLLTLVLAIVSKRYEIQKGMDMFDIYRDEA
jgi:hypothetical protein